MKENLDSFPLEAISCAKVYLSIIMANKQIQCSGYCICSWLVLWEREERYLFWLQVFKSSLHGSLSEKWEQCYYTVYPRLLYLSETNPYLTQSLSQNKGYIFMVGSSDDERAGSSSKPEGYSLTRQTEAYRYNEFLHFIWNPLVRWRRTKVIATVRTCWQTLEEILPPNRLVSHFYQEPKWKSLP